jgi:hypothetical protein
MNDKKPVQWSFEITERDVNGFAQKIIATSA